MRIPPKAGPRTRVMLRPISIMETALVSSSFGTMFGTEAVIAG